MPSDIEVHLHAPDVPDADDDEAPPLVGALIAGYGAAINPQYITKIETVRAGTQWFVRAWSAHGANEQNASTFLTPPLDSEQEAFDACDLICKSMFMVLGTNPRGVIHWPIAEAPFGG